MSPSVARAYTPKTAAAAAAALKRARRRRSRPSAKIGKSFRMPANAIAAAAVQAERRTHEDGKSDEREHQQVDIAALDTEEGCAGESSVTA